MYFCSKTDADVLEVLGTITGLLYLWLEYRASIHLWLVGIIMPAIYIFVYYGAGLYADCAFNVYYLLAAIYGWAVWRRKVGGAPTDASEAETNARGIERLAALPPRRRLKTVGGLAAVTAALFLLIGWVLVRFTDSSVPWWDAFTTALSIVGTWMLARKMLEQWWVWMVVDVVSAGLYAYKELHFTAALYLLYAAVAVFGYCRWLKMITTNPQE